MVKKPNVQREAFIKRVKTGGRQKGTKNKFYGAAINNRSAMRHGLSAGKLPKNCRYIELRLNKIRRVLEDAVVQAKGEISVPDAAMIQSAIRWEKHSELCSRWLWLESNDLKAIDKAHFSREIARGSSERDKAIRELGLPKSALKTLTLKSYIENAS